MRMKSSLTMVLALGAASFLTVSGAPLPARAGHDVKRTMEFLGFSSDGQRYLLLVRDESTGDFLSVRSFRTGKQLKGLPIDNPKDEKPLILKAQKRNDISDPGTASQSSPDGRFTLVGFPKGSRFHINAMRGERSASFHTIRLDRDGSTPADIQMKSVHWSRDGRRIVVVLHKRLSAENGIDADLALPFRFFGSSLNFK